jgi:hypothetical protein
MAEGWTHPTSARACLVRAVDDGAARRSAGPGSTPTRAVFQPRDSRRPWLLRVTPLGQPTIAVNATVDATVELESRQIYRFHRRIH